MAITLTDIQNAAAEGKVSAYVDDSTPAGHFAATAKILGHVTTYLLEGELGDENAEVRGRIVTIEEREYPETLGYAKSGLLGGYYLGRVESYADAFNEMIK